MSDLTFVAGDTGPPINGTLTTNGEVVNLTTAAEVRFRMRLAIDRRWKVDGSATVVSPTAGTVRYDLGPNDMDTPGEYVARWWVLWNDDSSQYSEQENTITVDSA